MKRMPSRRQPLRLAILTAILLVAALPLANAGRTHLARVPLNDVPGQDTWQADHQAEEAHFGCPAWVDLAYALTLTPNDAAEVGDPVPATDRVELTISVAGTDHVIVRDDAAGPAKAGHAPHDYCQGPLRFSLKALQIADDDGVAALLAVRFQEWGCISHGVGFLCINP